MKIINGHTYECFYQGIVVFCIDFKHYYDTKSAANALGISIEEFKKIW